MYDIHSRKDVSYTSFVLYCSLLWWSIVYGTVHQSFFLVWWSILFQLHIWYVIILICRFQPQFKGVDVSPLKDAAMDEYFTQPVKVCILWLLTYYLLVNYGQSDHRKVVEWQMHNSWKSLIGCCERSKTSFIFHATFPTLFNNVGNVAWMHWMTKASVLCNLSLYWPHPHAGLKHFLVYSNYHFILHGN